MAIDWSAYGDPVEGASIDWSAYGDPVEGASIDWSAYGDPVEELGAGRGTAASAAADPRRLDSIEGQARAGLSRDESKISKPDPSTLTAEQHRSRYTRGSSPITSGRSVLEDAAPLSVEQRVEAALRKDVESLPPDMRIGALRKMADGDGLQAEIARSMVNKEVSRTVLRDADPTNAKLLDATTSGQKGGRGALDKPGEKAAIPSDVPSSMDDWKLAPRDVAAKNLAADQALGENQAGSSRAAQAEKTRRAIESENPSLARDAADFATKTKNSIARMAATAPEAVVAMVRGMVRDEIETPAAYTSPILAIPGQAFQQAALAAMKSVQSLFDKDEPKTPDERAVWAARVASKIDMPVAARLAEYGREVAKESDEKDVSAKTQKAVANTEMKGNLLTGEGLSFGKSPTMRGFVMQAPDVLGSIGVSLLTMWLTKSPTAAGGVGAAMSGGEAIDNAREHFKSMTPEQVIQASPYARRMIAGGATPEEAKQYTINAAEDLAARGQALVTFFGDKFTGHLISGAFDKSLGRLVGQSQIAQRAAGAVTSTIEQGLQEPAESIAAQMGMKRIDPSVEVGKDTLGDAVLGAMGGPVGAHRIRSGSTKAGEALADALNSGQFTQSGVDSEVAARLGYGDTVHAPGSQVAQSVESRLADIAQKRSTAQAKADQIDALTDTAHQVAKEQGEQAVSDIGAQTTVDAAIAATQRAVNIDGNNLLNQALASAGINRDELDARKAQAHAEMAQADQDAAQVIADHNEATIKALAATTETTTEDSMAPAKVWYGRRGDGYQTADDAGRALKERQRLSRGLEWSVEQTPDGRFFLAGREIGNARSGQAQDSQLLQGQTGPQPTGRIAAEQTAPAQLDRATVAQQQSDVAVLREGLEADQPGSAASLRYAGDGGVSAHSESAVRYINDIGDITQKAFGWRASAVGGLNGFGVQYKGRLFIDAEQVARSAKEGISARALVIATIGHEGAHQLEKSADPADRAAHQKLRQVILSMAHDGVVERRHKAENKSAGNDVGRTYAENEVVADVNGGLWLDPKFWSRLYDIDNGSTMRRVAYKVMEAATKLIKAAKGSRLDPARFVKDVDAVREVAAQVWAEKAQRNGKGQQSLFDEKQGVSFSQAGVSVEVAPDPRDANAESRWNALTPIDKVGVTKEVMDKLAAKVFDHMGLKGWKVEYTSGMFEGSVNPSATLVAPDGTSAQTLSEVSKVFGYLLDQKGMVAFDENNTTSESQAGFVKVVLPDGLSTDRIDAIRKEIAARVPQAEGDTLRDGALVFGNFSEFNDKIETLTDRQFMAAVGDAVRLIDGAEAIDVAGPFRFHSEYAQAYWDGAYDPQGRDGYLENTRYGKSNDEATASGRDGVRGQGWSHVSRSWIENLARSTGVHIRQLVGDRIRQPARAESASVGRSAQESDGRVEPADGGQVDRGQSVEPPRSVGRSGADDIQAPPKYGKPIEGASSVVGYHFSRQPRQHLNSAYYGTGLKGEEAKRLAGRENDDIRPRVYFYVDAGNGVRPESGVGGVSHHVQLDNLYDATADKLGIVGSHAGGNAMERAIIDAGFDGYIARPVGASQHVAVVIGKKHQSIPVSQAEAPKATAVAPRTMPEAQTARTTRKGDMLVRNPVGKEMIEVIQAIPDIKQVAPSIKLEWGVVHVAASEAATVNAMMRERGSTFAFDEGLSRSRDFDDIDEFGAFNVDRQLSEMDDIETTEMSLEDFQQAVQDELDAEQASLNAPTLPSAEALHNAGIMAESAFDFDNLFTHTRAGRLSGFNGFGDVRVDLTPRANGDYALEVTDVALGDYAFMTTPNEASVKALVRQQAAANALRKQGFDLLDTYRKGAVMKLAAKWKQIAAKDGAVRSPMPKTSSTDFEVVAKEMGLFDGYEIDAYNNGVDFVSPSGRRNTVGIERLGYSDRFSICTIDLKGTDMGADVYAVMAVVAKNSGKKFLADKSLSGINTYRRTEQAMSFALKSGDTGVLLPGQQNRVYGYNTDPQTQQDHDENLARLALAGLRNAQEVFPDIRQLRYDAAQDRFTDSRGNDAEDKVKQALSDPVVRDFGLGRSTIARAVITSQIISGDTTSLDAGRFAKAVSYSLADVELDKPVGEGWGDEGGVQALNPKLRRFIAGSKIVNEDGTPKMMFHGTAQDIHAFRAKQAGAIFVTGSPRFAEDFASMSSAWMRANMDQVLTSEQIEQVKKDAIKAVMADKSRSMTERKALRQQIEHDDWTGAAQDAIDEAAGNHMPSHDNIIPVFVRAVYPFDYRNEHDVEDVVSALTVDGSIELTPGGEKSTYGEGEVRKAILKGEWSIIEAPEVQDVIRNQLGHDSFYVTEHGERNLAVYDPGSIKSVFNSGEWNREDDRLSYSRLDERTEVAPLLSDLKSALGGRQEWQIGRIANRINTIRKRLSSVNGAAFQDALLGLGERAVEMAVASNASMDDKRSVPIPMGATPHALRALGVNMAPVMIDSRIVAKVLKDKHAEDFSSASVADFVRGIYEPLAVIKGRNKDEMEVATPIISDVTGLPVTFMVKLNTEVGSHFYDNGQRQKGVPAHAIMSAYSKPSFWTVAMRDALKGGRLLYANIGALADAEKQNPALGRVLSSPAEFRRLPQTAKGAGAAAEMSLQTASDASAHNTVERAGALAGSAQRGSLPTSASRLTRDIASSVNAGIVKGWGDLVNFIGSRHEGDGADMPSFSRGNGQGFDLPEETTWQRARRRGQDYFLRALVTQNAVAEQGGTVEEPTNFYLAEELSHGRRGALSKDFADNTIAPLMEKAVRLKVDLDELALYAYAKHAPERNAKIAAKNQRFPDGGSGMTNADAAAVIAKVRQEGREQAFEDLHGDLMGIAAANRRVMLDEGLITQDEYDRLENDSQFYIPLRGFEKANDQGEVNGRSAGKGINVRGPETLKALGRSSRAGQLIENLIVDHLRTIDRSERNQVGKVFLNFVLQNPDPDLWEVDAPRTRQALNRQTGQVVQNTTIDKGEDTIAVKVQGREIYIKIHDPLLLRALRKAHKDETGDTERLLMRTAGLYTSLLRNTLTRYNPEFALTNALRDFGFGAAAMVDVLGEKGAAKFAAHYAGAIAASHRSERNTLDPQRREWDKYFTEFKMAGGMTAGFYVKNLDEIGRDIREMMLRAGARPTGFMETALNSVPARAVKAAGRVLEWAGSVSENAARVAAFRTAREMGKSASEAASIAKNLTTNFDRKGELGQLINSFYVFYNAAVQGSHRLLMMASNKKMWAYATAFGATGVMMALANAGWGGDDPDDGIAYWDKIPDFDKERNIIIMLPPGGQMEGAERVGTRGQYIKIPLQYGLNLPVAFGYVLADLIRNRQDKTRGLEPVKAGVTLASYLAGAFNPFGGSVDLSSGSSVAQAALPSIGDAVVQFTTGTNGFGRDVAPFKSPFDTKPDSENYNLRQAGGVSLSIARWLNSVSGGSQAEAGAIDISAGTVDNLIRNLTGGTGQFLNDSANLAWKSVDRATGGDPDLFSRDIPLARRVYGQLGGDVDQGIFYENRRKAQEAAGIVKRSGELGIEPKDESAVLAAMNQSANQVTRDLSKVRREMIRVTENGELTKQQKTERLRELRAARDQLTAQYNAAFKEVMRDFFADKSSN